MQKQILGKYLCKANDRSFIKHLEFKYASVVYSELC